MVADRPAQSTDAEKWCACIEGVLAKDDYLASIKEAGFADMQVLEERPYVQQDDRKISSITIRAVK